MGISNEVIDSEKENIENDLDENQEVIDTDKLAALKAKMKAKSEDQTVTEESDMPPKIIEERNRSLNIGVVGSGIGPML